MGLAYLCLQLIFGFSLSIFSTYLWLRPIYGFALSMAYPIYGFGLSMASAYIWLLSIYYKYGQVYLLCSILLVEHWYDRFIWPQPIYGLRLYMALAYLWLQPSFGFCLSMAWAYLRLWPIYSFSHQWLRLDLCSKYILSYSSSNSCFSLTLLAPLQLPLPELLRPQTPPTPSCG